MEKQFSKNKVNILAVQLLNDYNALAIQNSQKIEQLIKTYESIGLPEAYDILHNKLKLFKPFTDKHAQKTHQNLLKTKKTK